MSASNERRLVIVAILLCSFVTSPVGFAAAVVPPTMYRITSDVQLKGQVDAQWIIVDAGAHVTAIGDLHLRAASIEVNGSIVGEAGVAIELSSEADMIIRGQLIAGDGLSAGESLSRGADSADRPVRLAKGDNGDSGGALRLHVGASGVLRILPTGSIAAGDGGSGGSAVARGRAGEGGNYAESAMAIGGHGGTGGSVTIEAAQLDVQGEIRLGNGGAGGSAVGFGGRGSRDALDGGLYHAVTMGGYATALGGKGGASGALIMLPEPRDPSAAQSIHERIRGGHGGVGGTAEAHAGTTPQKTVAVEQARLATVVRPERSELPPIVDFYTKDGTSYAVGGDGGFGMMGGGNGGPAMAGDGAGGAAGTSPGADGGDAIALGGNGDDGGCTLGLGSAGGDGQDATSGNAAYGGIGGGTPIPDDNRGGNGGESTALGGDGGNGGNCLISNGAGGKGGDATTGKAGKGGKGGFCSDGGDGGDTTALGGQGGDGGPGGDGGNADAGSPGYGGLGASCYCPMELGPLGGPGGDGGFGGSCEAIGGNGGTRYSILSNSGDGGDATASNGGDGGNGGIGSPGGAAGDGGDATANGGNAGDDNANDGSATAGSAGNGGSSGSNVDCSNLLVIYPSPAQSVLFAWTNIANAYDVVYGNLAALASTGGSYGLATAGCVVNDTSAPEFDYPPDPPIGQGYWFLVRPVNQGQNGDYESGGPGQAAARTSGINGSGNDCP